jgi:hypothetical protein
MDIPSLFMIPSAVSSGKVHSVFPNSTDADFDFNRDSDATRVNSEGLIERVGYYGSELITNGDFATDSNWTKGSGWSISNGVAISSGIQTGNSNFYQVVYTTSKVYNTTLKVIAINGTLRVFTGTGAASLTITEVGDYEVLDKLADSSTVLYLQVTAGTTVTIDNVSVKEVLGDRARLNYEIEGGLVNTKPSLLLEPQSTNSFPNSEDYTVFTSASAGTGTNPIITSNYSISPDGTKNADRIQFNRGSGTLGADTSYITKSLSLGTIDATLSIYLKTNDGTTKDVTLRLGAALFDYDVTVTSEWQRFTLSGNTNVDRIQIILYGNKNSETADLSCFGTQVESLTYATSLIPTNGSTQTRAAETCNGAGTSSILPSEEGILYGEFAALVNDGTFRLFSLSDGTSANRVFLGFGSISNTIHCNITNSNVAQAPLNHTISDIKLFNKAAIRFKANDVQLYFNGVQVGTDTSATIPSTFSSVQFNSGSGSSIFYGKIRDIRVYNTKEMTDSEVDILLTKITS